MTNQAIPAEAVEAATKAFRETHFMGDALMNALEAAAPHMQPDMLEEWAVQFGQGSLEEAEDRDDAERKMREIRECIADGIESPLLEPMRIVSRYRVASSELTEWKPR